MLKRLISDMEKIIIWKSASLRKNLNDIFLEKYTRDAGINLDCYIVLVT